MNAYASRTIVLRTHTHKDASEIIRQRQPTMTTSAINCVKPKIRKL